MKIKVSLGRRIFDTCNVILMLALMIVMIYPLWHVACASLSDARLMLSHQGILILPKKFTLAAYSAVFTNKLILQSYLNTFIIVLGSLVVNMLLTSLGAYCLSRKNFASAKFIMKFITITMFFSGGMIPMYLLVTRTLGMYDSYWALILPVAMSTYNMIIMRSAFASIPDTLVEAAHLDGASHWQILFKIVLPLSMSTVSVIILYYAVAHWNSWFQASLYLKSRAKFPLQLILREILIQNSTESMMDSQEANQFAMSETIKYAIIMVATVPILIVYPYLQKFFKKGVMVGAVKG